MLVGCWLGVGCTWRRWAGLAYKRASGGRPFLVKNEFDISPLDINKGSLHGISKHCLDYRFLLKQVPLYNVGSKMLWNLAISQIGRVSGSCIILEIWRLLEAIIVLSEGLVLSVLIFTSMYTPVWPS